MSVFADLELHERLLKATDKLGYDQVTPVQLRTFPEARTGKDLVVSAKTGSGKTAAFVLPMLERFLKEDKPRAGTRGLILVPTRELALQIQKAFQALAGFTQIRCGVIIGGEAFKYQVSTIRRNPEVIIATPGRLVEHIEKNNIDFSDLEVLVLDEADRMLDMGFAEALHDISQSCAETRQNMLFSATFKHKAFSRVRAQLKDPVHIEVDSIQDSNENIRQQRVLADNDSHKEKLVAAIVEAEQCDKAFVFCNTRAQSQKVSNLLRSHKIRSEYIHGEISQSDRKQVLNRFRDNKIQVLVATDMAARGLDIEDVGLVINFNVPQSGDDHVHRIGRTGRASKQGLAITLVSAIEWDRMSSIERYLKVRFEKREVEGLISKYRGPKKVKSSGKAYGPKKKIKKKDNGRPKRDRTDTAASKKSRSGGGSKGKGGKAASFGDGSSPPPKR